MSRLGASQNPVVQVAGLIVGGLVAIGAILLGAVVLSLALGLAVFAGLILFVRIWWLKRRLGRASAGPDADADAGAGGEIVGVEYTVVKERTVTERDAD